MAKHKVKGALPPATPVCVGVAEACRLFDIGKNQIHAWVKSGDLKYSVLSSDPRAKKRFFTQDVAQLMREAQVSLPGTYRRAV